MSSSSLNERVAPQPALNPASPNTSDPVPNLSIPVPGVDHAPLPPSGPAPEYPLGSFDYDRVNNYPLLWDSMEEFHTWLRKEQASKTIELRRKEILRNREQSKVWLEKHIYVCARNGTGGKSKYQRKSERKFNIGTKRLDEGCPSRLSVKTYPGTLKVLGVYKADHLHDLGDKNLPFTRLTAEDRDEITHLLKLGVEPKKVLKHMHRGANTEESVLNPSQKPALRRELITAANVRRIQQKLDQENIRLADADGTSVERHVERLRKNGANVFLKRSCDPPPPSSGLAQNAFILIIQTAYQKRRFEEWGNGFVGLDATHNTTCYEGLSLFTAMLRDPWGMGFPGATMSSSNGTDATINFFLTTLRSWCPNVHPKRFMTDRDQAQINSIRRQYSMSQLQLCWWHVLHAWQQHFNASEFPELWSLLKSWIRITDRDKFNAHWEKIKAVAPPSVIEYLTRNWMASDVVEMWSAVYRQGFSVEEESDTNMLTEAWHHLLKGHFLQGKRNRRLDHLIYVMSDIAMPHFIVRHRRQELGFQGLNLRAERRADAEIKGAMISKAEIGVENNDKGTVYIIRSQTDSSQQYTVDMETASCTCPSFPSIDYCKHIHAVCFHFVPDMLSRTKSVDSLPISSLSSSTTSTADDLSNIDPQLRSQSITQQNDDDLACEIQYKLNALAARLQLDSLSSGDTSALESFNTALDDFTASLGPSDAGILPPKRKIAPNQHSWTETAKVMGVSARGAKKTKHTDPYSKGERSGQLAKQDAQHASKTATSSENQPPASSQKLIPLAKPFDAATFDLDDTKALEQLNRNELKQLCTLHSIAPSRGNDETIRRLQTRPSSSSTAPSSTSTSLRSSIQLQPNAIPTRTQPPSSLSLQHPVPIPTATIPQPPYPHPLSLTPSAPYTLLQHPPPPPQYLYPAYPPVPVTFPPYMYPYSYYRSS